MAAYQHPQLVAFHGKIRHGKSAGADYLISQHGFERVSFADPLKAMLMTLGVTRSQLYDQKQKEQPCAKLGGKTPRWAMQSLGTEWGRKMIYQDIWVDTAKRKMAEAMSHGARLVIDDLRFDNEAEAVRDLGGVVVSVLRPSLVVQVPLWRRVWNRFFQHASERGISEHLIDVHLSNDGALDDFYEKVEAIITRPAKRPMAA